MVPADAEELTELEIVSIPEVEVVVVVDDECVNVNVISAGDEEVAAPEAEVEDEAETEDRTEEDATVLKVLVVELLELAVVVAGGMVGPEPLVVAVTRNVTVSVVV